jgi:hypothetical protein
MNQNRMFADHLVLGFALDPGKISHVASAVGFAIGVDDLISAEIPRRNQQL